MKINTGVFRFILTMSCLSFAAFSSAEFELGATYYQAGNLKGAYEEFLEAAERGDYDAQKNVGVMYYKGEFVEKDIFTGYAWMKLSDQGKVSQEPSAHEKIYAIFSTEEKAQADKKYQALFETYGDTAIENKITPVFIGQAFGVQEKRPIKKVTPKYPTIKQKQGASGFVDVFFTINKQGITSDHFVYYSTANEFTKAALEAIRKNLYEPTKINNIPVDLAGYKIRATFSMEDAEYNTKTMNKNIKEMKEKAEKGNDNDKLLYGYFLEAISDYRIEHKIDENPNNWYLNAANQGSKAASYFLGLNILYGNMCKQDNQQSYIWLLKAAKAGLTDAQYMLALESFSGVHFEKNYERAFFWLEKAANGSKPAKIRYSWILATHPDEKRRDANLANKLLASIEKDYIDKQSFYQAWAAVAAEQGDFKQAMSWQKKAIKDAEELELPLDTVNARLAAYTEKKPWREEI